MDMGENRIFPGEGGQKNLGFGEEAREKFSDPLLKKRYGEQGQNFMYFKRVFRLFGNYIAKISAPPLAPP